MVSLIKARSRRKVVMTYGLRQNAKDPDISSGKEREERRICKECKSRLNHFLRCLFAFPSSSNVTTWHYSKEVWLLFNVPFCLRGKGEKNSAKANIPFTFDRKALLFLSFFCQHCLCRLRKNYLSKPSLHLFVFALLSTMHDTLLTPSWPLTSDSIIYKLHLKNAW